MQQEPINMKKMLEAILISIIINHKTQRTTSQTTKWTRTPEAPKTREMTRETPWIQEMSHRILKIQMEKTWATCSTRISPAEIILPAGCLALAQATWRSFQLREVAVDTADSNMLGLELQSHLKVAKISAIITSTETFGKLEVELEALQIGTAMAMVICLTRISKTANNSINNMEQVLQVPKA